MIFLQGTYLHDLCYIPTKYYQTSERAWGSWTAQESNYGWRDWCIADKTLINFGITQQVKADLTPIFRNPTELIFWEEKKLHLGINFSKIWLSPVVPGQYYLKHLAVHRFEHKWSQNKGTVCISKFFFHLYHYIYLDIILSYRCHSAEKHYVMKAVWPNVTLNLVTGIMKWLLV